MFEDPVYRAVVLGALLHDIGKLLQRGIFDPIDIRGQHPKVSADFVSAFSGFFGRWVDPDLLKTLVQRHHENSHHFPSDLLAQDTPDPQQKGLALLVSKADTLSSSERGKAHDQYQDFKQVPLATVFRGLEVKGQLYGGLANFPGGGISSAESLAGAFPDQFPAYQPGEYNDLILAFGREFRAFTERLRDVPFAVMLGHLLNLLYRFGWCIPANTQEDSPDVSLYDHLRTTCAIAACLYQRHKASPDLATAIKQPGEDFILAGGDVSGIQSYIFDIAHVGEGGVARRLRARSLMVQLLSEAVARSVLERLDLPVACQLMASGGNFYLLLPNTPEAEATLQQVAKEAERWGLEEMHGELSLHLAWAPLSQEVFRIGSKGASGFGQALAAVNSSLDVRKRQRFRDSLAQGQGWREDAFVLDVHYQGQGACPSCRKFPADSPEGLCRLCYHDRRVGALLPGARLLQLRRGQGLPLALPGWSADAISSPRSFQDGDVAVKLNDFDLADLERREASARFLANYIPYGEGDSERAPLTFEDIAPKSRGRPLLAFLKMDVDNLGDLMVFGLKRSDGSGDRDTISRVTTLSRLLDTFFSGWVQHLLETRFRHCYTVFSGGDDLLVVGPWDHVLDLALTVRDDFLRWTGRQDITISAGLAFTGPRYPLARATEDANSALKVSKDQGRDRITLLGQTRQWDAWRRAWERAAGLFGELERVPTAALYRLYEYGEMWQRWRDTHDPRALRFQPLLAYTIAREGLGRSPCLAEWAEGLLEIKPSTQQDTAMLDDMRLIARLLIFAKGGDRR